MRWFLNLSTRSKLLMSMGLMFLFVLVLVVTGYRNVNNLMNTAQRFHEEGTIQTDLVTLRSEINRQRGRFLETLLVSKRSEIDAINRDIDDRVRIADGILADLVDRTKDDPVASARLHDLSNTLEEYKQGQNKEVALVVDGNLDEAKKMAIGGVQQERYEKIRAMALDLANMAGKQRETALAQSRIQARLAVFMFVVVAFLAMMGMLLNTIVLTRAIAAPLQHISEIAERVAASDLTVEVPVQKRFDEVGVLCQTFQTMLRSLRETNRDIQEGVNVLASAATEIVAASSQVASGATESAAAINQTTTTVEEVKQTVHLSTLKAKQVSEMAQTAAGVSIAGKKAIQESVDSMNRIREQMAAIAEIITRLSERGHAAGDIISTVNDLAEQSNLLAVNAAIEAAKAGEYGRGFAVVAHEVKNLADQSKQATMQVRVILGEIQKATTTAVMAMEQGNRAVDVGARQFRQVDETIRSLSENVESAAESATQIAASSQQQLVGMDQVAVAMQSISQASTQNAASTKQMELNAHNLQELGLKLRGMVSRFTV